MIAAPNYPAMPSNLTVNTHKRPLIVGVLVGDNIIVIKIVITEKLSLFCISYKNQIH